MKVKNMLYAGLGMGTMVSKKTYEAYENFVKSGKELDPTVSSTIDDFFSDLENQKKEVRNRVEEIFSLTADKLGYIKLNEYENLLKRIKTLEAELAQEKNKK